MREKDGKNWKHCPICGARNSMVFKTEVTQRMRSKDYPAVDIPGLEGWFCNKCGDGFWTRASEGKITAALRENRARYDSQRVVAADIVTVEEAAKMLGKTRQGVYGMMKEGRLAYVFVGKYRLPTRKGIEAYSATRCLE